MEQNTLDRVTMELDTIRALFDRLRELDATARLRILHYVESLLGDEP